jgi:hypothetical protein
MKTAFKLLLAGVALFGLGALLGLWLGLTDQPLVVRPAALTADEMGRLHQVLRAADPRQAAPGQPAGAVRVLRLQGGDIDALVNDASQRLLRAPSRVVLEPGQARLQASMALPANPFGVWLNVEALVHETTGLPVLDRLQIGRLPVPAWLAEQVARRVIDRYRATPQVDLVLEMVQRVTLQPPEVEVAYVWRDDMPDRLREALVPPDEQQRLRAYTDRLVGVTRQAPEPVALTALLPPMFGLLAERCRAPACDADTEAREHRALLVTLAMHAAGQPMSRLVPGARSWPRPVARTVLLRGRNDFALHFLISAVIAAEGGGRLSNAIGIYKEVVDSHDGSGFSFNDIAADRAGTRFGQVAVREPRRLDGLREAAREEDFMPVVDDLPEFMPDAAFRARYGGVGAPAYQQMMARIEGRVMACPLLR